MKLKFLIIIILMPVFRAGDATAGPAEIQAQQGEWDRLQAVQDSLLALRNRLADELERLSVRIDSLKAETTGARAGGALQEALRRSVGLVARLEAADRSLEGVRAELKALRERLREAYDREIGALIGRLGKTPDQALIRQLTAYQQAREALARAAAAEQTRPGGELLVIRAEDGPDEIRQKANLMEDMAARLRAEAQTTERRLHRLEEERRLRARVTTFARELTLFDENLPEGRAIAAGERAVSSGADDADAGEAEGALDAAREGAFVGLVAEPEAVPAPEEFAGGDVVAAREVSPGGEHGLTVDLSADDLVQEIERLKAHQAALQARNRALREQVEVFRKRIQQMAEEWK